MVIAEKEVSNPAEIFEYLVSKHKDNTLVLAHADHDGQCSALALKHIFKTEFQIEFSSDTLIGPEKLKQINGKKLLIVSDVILSSKHITSLIEEKDICIVDIDHHAVKHINHDNYHCMNPKKLYNKDFISSAGLLSILYPEKSEEADQIIGAGTGADICIEDMTVLFSRIKEKYPGMLKGTSVRDVLNSRLFEAGNHLLLSSDTPEYSFKILEKCLAYNSLDYLLCNPCLKAKKAQRDSEIDANFKKIKTITTSDYTLMDSSNMFKYAGSYSVKANIDENSDKTYIEYHNGKLFFRNFFGKENVKKIAQRFKGEHLCPNSRTGIAFTKMDFDEVSKEIAKHYLEK